MHNDRKTRLGIFAILMVCALMLPIDGFTAAAAEEKAPTQTARAVMPLENARVLQQADPTPMVQTPDSTTGYIEKEIPTPKTVQSNGLSYQEVFRQRKQVLDTLHRHLGTPYVYGGAWPGGFDCSGIIYYIYNNLLGYPITRCADTQLLYDGTRVSSSELQLGDLVFFRDPGSPWAASHAGIYIGNRMMIHASSSKGLSYASIDSAYFSSRYVGAKRIIPVDTTTINPDFSGINLR